MDWALMVLCVIVGILCGWVYRHISVWIDGGEIFDEDNISEIRDDNLLAVTDAFIEECIRRGVERKLDTLEIYDKGDL